MPIHITIIIDRHNDERPVKISMNSTPNEEENQNPSTTYKEHKFSEITRRHTQ